MKPTALIVAWLLASLAASPSLPSVRHFGSLREMMHEGKTGPAASLPDVVHDRLTIGVGALSELRGEITILDGQVWISTPDGPDGYRTRAGTAEPETAALVVLSEVESWREIVLAAKLSIAEFESTLSDVAQEHGFDAAFPFVVEALFPRLELHIVDGTRLSPGASHEKHRASAVAVVSENVPATLVGFHSTTHQGIFTHHDRTTHVHALVASPLVTGHVDAAVIPAGAILKIPR